MSAVAAARAPVATGASRRLAPWWPLAALTLLAAALRFATLGEQSFWYDEAYTPVHVLHAGLGATLSAVVHHENTPPLWYLIAWLDARVFGDGALALRLPSALAGTLTVPVVWAICAQLASRRAAVIGAAIVAVQPLLVWYSQEARAYELFVLTIALAMLCFVRALEQPARWRIAAFALAGALALSTHYFAVFPLLAMAAWLLWDRRTRRAAVPAAVALAIVGLALLPLISAQGGHGTQWIGRWALSSRLQAIPQYYLTGYSGAPLGHGVELLVALPVLLGAALGAWRLISAPLLLGRHDLRRGAWIAFSLSAVGVLAPIVLVAFGADYLAPRNLVGAMVPVSVLLAILLAAIDVPFAPAPAPAPGADEVGAAGDGAADRAGGAEEQSEQGGGGGRIVARGDPPAVAPDGVREQWIAWLSPSWVGAALAATIVVAFVAISIDVDLSPRLQRGNWRDVAHALERGSGSRAITTVELGAAPLEYYLSRLHLHNLARGARIRVSEIDETGYAPLRRGAGRPPASGFELAEHREIDGLTVFRFVSSVPRLVSEAQLRRHVITPAHPEVLVPAAAHRGRAVRGVLPLTQMSSSDENI